ncbi:hypothetical protein [Bathymodiolus thermophilus thioautotrophic gill symbiont]|uniref:hypothetical protein n=1 Tax=Bathymodiolus thermophilus thioautotrophic gill symbiont TaxID=2360 RepID=UPI001117240C|nr:hypothetical protein [Bathymodiolus thermophilus thioautotrophic gill symbiont]
MNQIFFIKILKKMPAKKNEYNQKILFNKTERIMKITRSKPHFRFNYFFVFLFIFALTEIIYANQSIAKITANKSQKTNSLCDLPEDANVFRQYIKEKYGDKISYEKITDLEKEFDKKYKEIASDWLAKDKNTKIKYVTLGRKCTTKDGVNYLIGLSMVFNKDNKYIIHTPYWKYSHQAFLDKKRPPYFSLFDKKMAEKILKRDAVGMMNKTQFDKYIRGTGAVAPKEAFEEFQNEVNKFLKLPFTNITKLNLKKVKDDKYKKLKGKQQEVYFYPLPFDALFRFAPMAYLDVAREVIVEFDQNNIVKKITVK